MRILHISQYCHAGSVGGTERYILDLIRGLAAAGIHSTFGWVTPGSANKTIGSEGVKITTLPAPQMRVDSPLPEFQQAAERLLDTEKPDFLHFHTFGLTEAALAKLAKQRGIPYAFTYHSPAWTCRRETGLLYGKEPCDGQVRAWRCSACQCEERLGKGRFAAHAATFLSMSLGWALLPLGRSSLRRRAAFYYDTARFSRAIRNFLSNCDLVVSCCDWSGPLLRSNGAREKSLFHCPQGVPNVVTSALETGQKQATPSIGNEFIVGYVGRVTEVKGVHILMEGFSRMAGEEARLRIVGWEPEHADAPYARRLQQIANADPRIKLVPKTSFNDTVAEYKRLSLLAVPSVWMETGPLTLMEALALGVPVYGSNRIGQLNLLREHGQVVEPNTPAGWQAAMTGAFGRWKQGLWNQRQTAIPLRTMADLSVETIIFYKEIIGSHADQACVTQK
jgi:glycosyltransferase involved in cell wall biosynthesis